ncbi:MAG: flagellar basal body P-ring formation chaperone FlgA [Candidatus Margulisiibacteriota bacterium]
MKRLNSKFCANLVGFWLAWLVFFCILLAVSGDALSNPEESVTGIIKNYIIEKYPDWLDLDIRITFKQADKNFDKMRAIKDESDLRIGDLYQDFKPAGNVIFPFDSPEGRFFVRAKVEAFKNIVYARGLIRRGGAITLDDLAMEKRDIAMLPPGFFSEREPLRGMEAKTTIPKGSTLFEWMVKKVPLIRRGDEVMILLKGEGLLVKAKGVALMEGSLNDRIKVQRQTGTNSSKTLEGVLISPKEVEVNLE